MNTCSNCGAKSSKSSSFCSSCGQEIQREQHGQLRRETSKNHLPKLKVPLLTLAAAAVVGGCAYGAGHIYAASKSTEPTAAHTTPVAASSQTAPKTTTPPTHTAQAPQTSAAPETKPAATTESKAPEANNGSQAGGVFKSAATNVSFELPAGIYASENTIVNGETKHHQFFFGHEPNPTAENAVYNIVFIDNGRGSNGAAPVKPVRLSYRVDDYTLLPNVDNLKNSPETAPEGTRDVSPRVVYATYTYNTFMYSMIGFADETVGTDGAIYLEQSTGAPINFGGMSNHNGHGFIFGGVKGNTRDGYVTDYVTKTSTYEDKTKEFDEFSAIAKGMKFN